MTIAVREQAVEQDTGAVTEPTPEPAAEPAPTPEPPRRRRVLDHVPFALVLSVAFVGGILIILYHWRWGSALIGGALMLAALFRAILPEERAGLLAVRGRPVDVLSYAGLSLCILFVAYTLQSPAI